MSAEQVTVPHEWLTRQITHLLTEAGVSPNDALVVARSLVDADRGGIHSHGAQLASLYVDRILQGSVSADAQPVTVVDLGAIGVLDGQHGLGQTAADHSMHLAIAKAREFGIGAVTTRHAFHFGAASRYVERAALDGMIGMIACNTRPLMPAPGGARAVVGNNPIAFGIPRAGADPIVVDMAMSEAAMGKIRGAAAAGQSIPDTWATDSAGQATTNPAAAIAGMLLPMGGAKGYGLALTIELLSGVLGGGAFGPQVNGLYANLGTPYDCSFFTLAIDPSFFGDDFADRAEQLATWVESSPAAEPGSRVYLPGQRRAARVDLTRGGKVTISATVVADLEAAAERLGTTLDELEKAV